MKLSYNILWIDNDLEEYIERGETERLNEFLYELGFEPNIIAVFDDNEVDGHLDTKFDLIISDYNLDSTTGDKIVANIRKRNILTEILFYSARTNFKDDPEVADRLRFIDRITFVYGRDNLMPRIEGLIQLTLDKLLDLNATRGLITSATSDLDVIIEEFALHIANNELELSDEQKVQLIDNYIDSFLSQSPNSFKKRYTELGFNNTFPFIEAYRKWKIFRQLLKEYQKTKSNSVIANFIKQNSSYSDEVINVRNKFAHAKAIEINGKTKLKGQYGKEDFEFDKNACIQIRKNLIKHKNNFSMLREQLGI